MTRLLTSRRLRWTVPAVIATGVAAAAITTGNGAGASEQPNLPPLSAAQLLTAVQHAHPAALSGTIVETADLGLPNLPGGDLGGATGLSLQSLLTGSHTMRVWYAGPNQQRVAVLAPMSERDVVHNGKDLWSYTSTTNAETHATVGTSRLPAADLAKSTPQHAAQQALRAVDPTTRVKVDRTARVAGRPVYQLDLVPRDSRSLVGSVRIAVDAATSTPLRVQVFAAGSTTPALQVGFTNVSFGTPDPSVFSFVPPAGAKVTTQRLPTSGKVPGRSKLQEGSSSAGESAKVLGTGWTAVAELPSDGLVTGSNARLLDRLSTTLPGGDRLISTSLVSVLITKSGHIFAGSVSGSNLEHVAATGHGL